MYLVLDTNILIQEGLNSRNMKILERIVASGELNLCIPEIVLKEFVTHNVLEAKEVFKKPNAHFLEIQNRLPDFEVAPFAKQLIEQNERYEELLKDNYAKAIDNWVKDLKIEILKFDNSKVAEVFDDYFVGKGAFRSPKFRPDIPDSFIAYSILPLLDKGENVNVIVKDTTFSKYLSFKKMDVFLGLNEFISSDKVKSVINKLDTETKNVDELKVFLASEQAISLLRDLIQNDEENLQLIYVEEDQISGLNLLEMDAFGVSVNGTSPEFVHQVSMGDVQYVQPGFFSIPVCIEAHCDLHFATEYYEYIHLPNARINRLEMTSIDGDGIVELVESRNTLLNGYLQVQFNESWTVKEFSAQLSKLSKRDEHFEVDIDVIAAQLI